MTLFGKTVPLCICQDVKYITPSIPTFPHNILSVYLHIFLEHEVHSFQML